jgi:glycosyltransferase involved in cell wall biosynthesis
MKLLLYSHSFAPNVGGVETIVLSLARGLAELRTVDNRPRFELTLVTETPAGDFDGRSLPFPVVRKPSALALKRLIDAADVTHLAGPALLPLSLAWLSRRPVVLEHHGYQSICPNGLLLHQPDGSICPGHFQARQYWKCIRCQAAEMSWLKSFAQLLLMFPRNLLVRSVACNIAVSRHVSERIVLPRSRVVYHGVENASGSEIAVAEIPPAQGKLRFAYVGRLVAEKGLSVLLQATEILKREKQEFELLMIGDGPQRAHLEALAARAGLGDCVQFTGILEGPALADALGRVHVIVMPSVWEETAGLAAMEHMMRGRLVIASKIGGLCETVGDAGLMCQPRSAGDLARCMREVLCDRSLVATLGRKGRERAQSLFLRDRMIADHVGVYRGILGRDT